MHAQTPADTLPADTIPGENTAPRNAFIRALILPGWGHFYIGSPGRGAFYVATEGASWYMLVKTLKKLSEARDKQNVQVGLATDSLRALMANDSLANVRLADAEAFNTALGQHAGVAHARGLVNSRTTQRQDWVTYTLFFTFASAVDAYVTAHLKGFPGEIAATPGMDGSLSLRVQLPLGAVGRAP